MVKIVPEIGGKGEEAKACINYNTFNKKFI